MPNTEVRSALMRLNVTHSHEVIGIASMHHLCRHLLSHYCTINGADPAALVGKLDACVDSHLFDRDIPASDYQAGLAALQSTGMRVAASASSG